MRTIHWFGLILLLGVLAPPVQAQAWKKHTTSLALVNEHLQGQVIDYTANHGKDNRFWARSLFERRDMYVYLPPGCHPGQTYPVMIWMHDVYEDEQSFLCLAPLIDQAIVYGHLPPLIVVAPDGSFKGEPHPHLAGSFFINTNAGYYGDYILQDVWDFVTSKYPICADRCAHILAGVGMGGFAAYHHGIKHRYAFGTVIGLMPALNMRWQDKAGHYCANFSPYDWGWRLEVGSGKEIIALLDNGIRTVRLRDWIGPLYGLDGEAVPAMARDNPIELMQNCNLQPGELNMYVGYSAHDEFNLDAQVESFLYAAKYKGLKVCVDHHKHGHHNVLAAKRLLPKALAWLTPRIAPFSPPLPPGEALPTAAASPAAADSPDSCTRRPHLRRHPRNCGEDDCYPPISLPDYHHLKR